MNWKLEPELERVQLCSVLDQALRVAFFARVRGSGRRGRVLSRPLAPLGFLVSAWMQARILGLLCWAAAPLIGRILAAT